MITLNTAYSNIDYTTFGKSKKAQKKSKNKTTESNRQKQTLTKKEVNDFVKFYYGNPDNQDLIRYCMEEEPVKYKHVLEKIDRIDASKKIDINAW